MTILLSPVAGALVDRWNRKLVMALSDQVVVMENGRKIAEGTAEAIRDNPLVVGAYLGHK